MERRMSREEEVGNLLRLIARVFYPEISVAILMNYLCSLKEYKYILIKNKGKKDFADLNLSCAYLNEGLTSLENHGILFKDISNKQFPFYRFSYDLVNVLKYRLLCLKGEIEKRNSFEDERYACKTCKKVFNQADAFRNKKKCDGCKDSELELIEEYLIMNEGCKMSRDIILKLEEKLKLIEESDLPPSYYVTLENVLKIEERGPHKIAPTSYKQGKRSRPDAMKKDFASEEGLIVHIDPGQEDPFPLIINTDIKKWEEMVKYYSELHSLSKDTQNCCYTNQYLFR